MERAVVWRRLGLEDVKRVILSALGDSRARCGFLHEMRVTTVHLLSDGTFCVPTMPELGRIVEMKLKARKFQCRVEDLCSALESFVLSLRTLERYGALGAITKRDMLVIGPNMASYTSIDRLHNPVQPSTEILLYAAFGIEGRDGVDVQ